MSSSSNQEGKAGGADYHAHLFTFSGGNKAGMDSMDKEKQAKVIYEMSKDTPFFKRAEEQNRKTEEKVKEMKNRITKINNNDLQKLTSSAIVEVEKLETKRNLGNICCVLDMDMFFAAVEIRDRPELKDKPVAVGSTYMISTSNYVARKYGVRAAMPGFIGKRLCPELVFVDSNFKKYEFVGGQIRGVVKEYDPNFRSFSLDEVYMDLTAVCKRRLSALFKLRGAGDTTILCAPTSASAADTQEVSQQEVTNQQEQEQFQLSDMRHMAIQVANEIRARITELTGGLTCSAGIAHNFLLAKIGADINKPDGLYSLQPTEDEDHEISQVFGCHVRKPPTRETILNFVHNLPCRKIGGIGKVMDNTLRGLGYSTMGGVYNNVGEIIHLFPGASGKFLLTSCVGVDSYEIKSYEDAHKHATNRGGSSIFGFGSADQMQGAKTATRKSMSVSRTFSGTSDQSILKLKLMDICEKVANDLKKESLSGRSVTLNLKNTQFQSFSKCVSATVAHSTSFRYVQSSQDIFEYALPLLPSMLPMTLRLIGVSISKFEGSTCDVGDTGSGNGVNFLNHYFKKDEPCKSVAPP